MDPSLPPLPFHSKSKVKNVRLNHTESEFEAAAQRYTGEKKILLSNHYTVY